MAVGDGVTNWTYDTQPATMNMTYWHAVMGQEMYDQINEYQCDYSLLNFNIFPSAECLGIYNDFLNLTSGLDMYNIFKKVYGPTENDLEINPVDGNRTQSMMTDHSEDRKLRAVNGHLETTKKTFSHKDYTPWMFAPSQKQPLSYIGAIASPIDYLNSEAVKTALHIPAANPAWGECAGSPTIEYTMFQKASQWIWEELKGKYRMMHYSGNVDAVVPTQGTLAWINALNRTVVNDWRQYSVGGQVGGWIKDFDGLTFAEVNGAGHMVPQDKPEVAQYLIYNWIAGNPIPAATNTANQEWQ